MEKPGRAGEEKSLQSNDRVLAKLNALYREAFEHNGFAEIRVEIRFLRRGQKEVILHCGKQYRFVVDYDPRVSDGISADGTETVC